MTGKGMGWLMLSPAKKQSVKNDTGFEFRSWFVHIWTIRCVQIYKPGQNKLVPVGYFVVSMGKHEIWISLHVSVLVEIFNIKQKKGYVFLIYRWKWRLWYPWPIKSWKYWFRLFYSGRCNRCCKQMENIVRNPESISKKDCTLGLFCVRCGVSLCWNDWSTCSKNSYSNKCTWEMETYRRICRYYRFKRDI